jgi:photosystem II stability/assembly factor-like uncharacterized protein
MKKITTLICILICQYSFAQLEIIGSSEYGRIQFLNYDSIIPNKIYATSSGHHIVVSHDNGVSWSVLYSFPTIDYKQISMLKIHSKTQLSFTLTGRHNNTNKIYILDIASQQIISEYTIPNPVNSNSSSIYSYSFYDDNTLIVSQWWSGSIIGGKVYYSNNGGNSWNTVYDNIDNGSTNPFPNSVAISPNNPNKILIGRQGGFDPTYQGGLLISNDAGQTWEEKLTNIDFGPIVFHPTNFNEILLGSTLGSATQNLYRSTDGGNNWNIVDTNWSNEVLNGIFEIEYNPLNSNNIIILGVNEIVRTYDNFQTKEVIQFQNEIENPNNYYFGTRASFNPFNTSEIIISNNDYPLKSFDGGATVSKVDNPFFFSHIGQLNLFKNSNSKHLYYSVQNGYIHKNLSSQQETPYGLFPLQVFPFTTNKFYTDDYLEGRIYGFYESSNGSGLSFSNDHGENVFGIASPNTYLHAITSNPINANLLICSLSDDYANSNLVQFDINDTNNVQITTITLPEQGLLRDFHFDIANPSQMWIALGRNVYKTINNGSVWTLQSNGLESLLADDKIYQIIQNPLLPNQLTLATSKGIFTSINNGNNWIQLSIAEVQSVKHSDINSNHLVAVTYDTEFTTFALRYSNDSGVTWQQVPIEDLLYVNADRNSVAVDFSGNSAIVYIGTYDLGVIKYTIDFSTLSSSPILDNVNDIRLYPSPTQNILNIQTQETITGASVYDLLGKKVKVNQISTNSLDVSNLAKGVYVIKVIGENDKTFSTKFIKN